MRKGEGEDKKEIDIKKERERAGMTIHFLYAHSILPDMYLESIIIVCVFVISYISSSLVKKIYHIGDLSPSIDIDNEL